MIRWLATLALILPAAAFAADSVRRAPPPTATSQIWLHPGLRGTPEAAALAKAGYVREEWFQSGTANV